MIHVNILPVSLYLFLETVLLLHTVSVLWQNNKIDNIW
jgi:hypothetical protein